MKKIVIKSSIIILSAEYKKKKREFNYYFEVSETIKDTLIYNINEIMDAPLKDYLKIPYTIKPVQIRLKNRE